MSGAVPHDDVTPPLPPGDRRPSGATTPHDRISADQWALARLVDGIHDDDVARVARELLDDDRLSGGTPAELARRAIDTCARIRRDVDDEARHLTRLLADAGCPVRPPGIPDAPQRHELRIDLDGHLVDRAADVLVDDGYHRLHQWTRGAARSARRHGHELFFSRPGATTFAVRLRWRPARARTRFDRMLRPTPADWDAVTLPSWAWRAYPLVRVGRLALERTGLRNDDHGALEPFLATPRSLVGPLLDVAEVGSDDLLADLGCGDGRIVIDGARTRGCRALGVEYSAELVATARRAVGESGLDDLVTIEQGDGLASDLDGVTVVLLFLPVGVAADAIPELLERLRPGARIIAHEQSALPDGVPTPTSSVPLIAEDALTVAHLWTV